MDFEKLMTAIRKALGLPESGSLGDTLTAVVDFNKRIAELEAGAKARQTEEDAIIEELKGRLARSEKLAGKGEGLVTLDSRGRVVPALSAAAARCFQNVMRLMLPEGTISNEIRDEARAFHRELNITTGSQGGFLIPAEFSTEFIQLVNVYSSPRQMFTRVPMKTDGPLTMPALNGDMDVYWVDEHAAPTESHPTFSQFSISNQALAALTHLSVMLLSDSSPAALQLVVQSMARAFAKEESRVGFNGKSVADGGSDKYTGLFNLTGATVSSLSAGKTSIENIGLKDLTNAINAMITAVGEAGLDGARWIMNPTILSVIEDLTDSTGRPLVRNAGDGDVSMLRGYPIERVSMAPSLATDAAALPFIALCNPSVMAIGDRQGVEIAQDSSVGFKNFQLFVRGMERIGFAPMIPTAVVLIKTAAS